MSVTDAQGRVYCNWCDDMVPEQRATPYDVSRDEEYYPRIRWICDNCKRRWFETDDTEDTDNGQEGTTLE